MDQQLKAKVAWLKIQEHKWTDGTGNSLAALAALDSKYNSIKTKDKQVMITEFYMFKMEASQKPDEASAQLQVLQGELRLFADPHTISDNLKEVGLRLVASLYARIKSFCESSSQGVSSLPVCKHDVSMHRRRHTGAFVYQWNPSTVVYRFISNCHLHVFLDAFLLSCHTRGYELVTNVQGRLQPNKQKIA